MQDGKHDVSNLVSEEQGNIPADTRQQRMIKLVKEIYSYRTIRTGPFSYSYHAVSVAVSIQTAR